MTAAKHNVEFPAHVLKHGSEFEWDGEMFDALTVNDEDELAAALKDGWSLGKPEKPAKGKAAAKPEPEETKDA